MKNTREKFQLKNLLQTLHGYEVVVEISNPNMIVAGELRCQPGETHNVRSDGCPASWAFFEDDDVENITIETTGLVKINLKNDHE